VPGGGRGAGADPDAVGARFGSNDRAIPEFRLTFAAETNPGLNTTALPGPDGATTAVEPASSVFDAVKQYGLRLETRKAPIEMLIVTQVEKTPTEN
jgi:uncharacterized protein (TIGR03435 family)